MSGNGSNKFSNFGKDRETQDVVKTMNLPDGSNISQTSSPSVSVSAQMQHTEQQNSPGVPIETDTTGQGSSRVSENNHNCHVRADGQDVRAAFGMSTSPTSTTTPCTDLPTKSTPSDQHFSHQYNMMPKPVLPMGEGNFKSHSSQSGSQDNDRPKVHRDSLTKTQSANVNDKLPEAIGSIAGGDDKWDGLLKVTNDHDDMNDVDMEDDKERISESRKSDQIIADARDYNAEGAKPKTEPGKGPPPPWKEFFIMILNSEDKRVLEQEKITVELQPLKMQYLLHCQMEVLLKKIRTDSQALKIRNFVVEKERLVISISKLTDAKVIPDIVNLLQEEVDKSVKVKRLSAHAFQSALNELQLYLDNGDIAIYCEDDKIYLVGITEVIDGLTSHLSEINKKSTMPQVFCQEVKCQTSFDAHLLHYFGLESLLSDKFPTVTCNVNEEQRMVVLSGDEDHVLKAVEELNKFGKSFQSRELSVTPLRIQLLGLKEIQNGLEKILEEQNLKAIYITFSERNRIIVYCKEDSAFEDFQSILETAFTTMKYSVVREGSPEPTFATSKAFVAFLDANENKNLVLVRDAQTIRISTTANFASKIFEMEKAFNSENQQTEKELSLKGTLPGLSTESDNLQILKLEKLQYCVLKNLDFISFLNKEIPTCKAEIIENAITFIGTKRDVKKKMKTFFDNYIDFECVKHVQEKTSEIPEKMLEFVQKENVMEYINKKLEKEDILCYWYSNKDDGDLKLFTLKGTGSKAVAVVKQCLDWEEFTCTPDVNEIWKEKSMEIFLKEQKSNLMLDFYDEDLVVVGLEDSMRKFVELYHKIVHANAKLELKQTLNQHSERTDLSRNILQHVMKFHSDEFKRKWNVTFKEENEVVLLVGETSAVQKALDSLKKSSYIEQKWSCHVDKPAGVIKEISSKSIPQLENQFRCSVFTDVNTSCISHQQLAQWVSQTKDQRIVFVHGSVTDMAADVIVCPVTKRGGVPSFGKIGKAIFKLGGSEMSRFENIVISSATGNLPCLMVAYFPVPVFRPGLQLQSEMFRKIQDVLIEVEKTQLQSVVITTDIGNDIPEPTFLHWFLDAYKAYQHKLNCVNQIYLCTESDNPHSLLTILKDGLSNCHGMFDFTDMFEQRYDRYSVNCKPADISITLVKGKLVDQKVNVIVNSSNKQLNLKKGAVSASILAAAGEGIYEECRRNYPNGINYGDVITTNHGNLNCKVICHGCLPHWYPIADISSQILAKLVFTCLLHAENYNCESIAFPVFGTGNLMYPWDEVAKTMIRTVYKYGRKFPDTAMKEVRIVLYDKDYDSIEAFEQEKSNMEEVTMRPEDPVMTPSNILECRCKNVRVKIEPLSSVEFHHCQAIVMTYTYQEALGLQRDEPHSKLWKDKTTIERSKTHKFWVISVIVNDQYQTFDEAINRALTICEEKRLSTLAISLNDKVTEWMSLIKQATQIRNCVNKRENICYLQILKLMITNREDFNQILTDTIQKQEKERGSLHSKVSDWLNISKMQWKYVKYSETLQSPRLYLTIVGEDEKSMTTLLQKLTKEITILKEKGCQNLGASIRSARPTTNETGHVWIRTSKNNEKIRLPEVVCQQLDEAVKYKQRNAEIVEGDDVYNYDLHTKQYTIQGDKTPLGIFTTEVYSPDPKMARQEAPLRETDDQIEDIFKDVSGMIHQDLHTKQSMIRAACEKHMVKFDEKKMIVKGTLDKILSLNKFLLETCQVKTGLSIAGSKQDSVPKRVGKQETVQKNSSAQQPLLDNTEYIINIKIPYMEYKMLKFYDQGSFIWKGFKTYQNGVFSKMLQPGETEEMLTAAVNLKLKHFQSFVSIEILPEFQIDDSKLHEIEREVLEIGSDIFCFRSKDKKILTLKGSQYEKLQNAKTKAEFILGMKKHGKGVRRHRVIDTDANYLDSEERKQSNVPSNDMNTSQSKFSRSLSGSSVSSSSTAPKDMTFKTSDGLVIKVYVGNILKLDVECIVNAANEQLSHGGGVADVISRAAGYSFQKESDSYIQQYGKVQVTKCCTTSAGDLPYKCVIHAVGPRWYDYPSDKNGCAEDLKKTIENCFFEAEVQNVSSIALPAISSGIFGVPKGVCCMQYCKAVIDYNYKNGKNTCLKEIHFMDKDSEMIKMIQDEFGQHLNIDQLVAPSGNANFQQSGRDTRKDEKGHLSRSFSGDPDTEQDKGRISGDFGIARKPDQFKCQFITENGFKVHIVEENITKVKADVIVCPQDHRCQSKGQIAKAIEEVSDSAYRNDMYTMKSVTKCENRRYKASPYTLPFRYVLHTVPPLFDNNAARDRAKFAREIALTIRNIIRHCSDSSGISSVAIPVLGVGIEGNVTPYGTFVSTLATQIVKESQSEKFKLQEIFIVIHDSAIASTIASNFDKEEGFKKVTSFQRLRKRQNKDSTEGQKSDDGNGAKTKSSERLGTTVTGGNLDDCVICMDKPEDPRKLKCGHIFCQGCIGQHFKLNNPVCPTCGSIQGELTGNQPPGTMKVYRFSSSLSGYPHCGRIVIDYDIPGGYQGKEHKTPGRSYEGIRRSGYLPDNGKGQLVAKMLRIAFDRKMVFTIGDSRTTGKQGVVTWNDIHHKTNPNPHGQFGYPDETYLDRVIDELSAKGITEQDVGPDTKLY